MKKKKHRPLEFKNFISLQQRKENRSGSRSKKKRLNQAQDLIYLAWELEKKKDRVELAREALKLTEDCGDAWNILAEDSVRSPIRKLYYYEKGLEASERVLGEAYFRENVGHFWSNIQSRPFMRSLSGYSLALWSLGQKKQAIQCARELLRLNPNDNQGNRYLLMSWLLQEKDLQGVAQLLFLYDEMSVEWAWAMVLHSFLTQNSQSSRLIRDAIELNPLIPGYLTGQKKLPKTQPYYYELGGESEAIIYAHLFGEAWRTIPGAIEMLNQNMPGYH